MSKQQIRNKKNRIIVGSRDSLDIIPSWLLEEVKAERLIYGMGSLINPECQKVGDAEVCVYLMTASLNAPMSHNYSNIYIYLSVNLMKRKGMEIPSDFKEHLERGLSIDEERELDELRSMIYHKRGGEIDTPILNMLRAFKKGGKIR